MKTLDMKYDKRSLQYNSEDGLRLRREYAISRNSLLSQA